METVGAATWSHSINALRPGGTLVISGTTSGAEPEAELTKTSSASTLPVIGSTMGPATSTACEDRWTRPGATDAFDPSRGEPEAGIDGCLHRGSRS